ncbi:MAG: HEAT repeat domain-containing protein [Gemmataceae bacterium]
MPPFARAAALFAASALTAATAGAAPPEQIDAAIARGVNVLKTRFKDGGGSQGTGGAYGTGPSALAGIALLEANTPATDPTVKAIAAAVRDQAYRESQTYQIALCLLFLDRLEDPADVPVIQMLGARLLVGQTARGGWTYACVASVPAADEQRLRAGLKGAELVAGKDAPPGTYKLHPMVQEYLTALVNARGPAKAEGGDNSNTQFGILAAWACRKYGLPADGALDLIERRFHATQAPDGSWTYGSDTVGVAGSPAMTCAGLLGIATAIGRREEKRAKTEAPKGEPPAKTNDPFFNPPPRPDGKAAGPKRPLDVRDQAAVRGFGYLGAALRAGHQDLKKLYSLWSLERVGVLYGVDKIGGVDWYAGGSDYLVALQAADGAWPGEYGPEVDTSFAVLFLCKANLARDLSRRVRGDSGSELRAGAAAPVETGPAPKGPVAPVNPLPVPVAAPLPPGAAGKVATDLVAAANGAGFAKSLSDARDAKGSDYTAGLAAAVHRLDGEAKKTAREALADRLARMSAATLRGLMGSSDPEVRRGAVLAAAMRDDKDHVPDLIERINDEDDRVVRAARAGLRSLTGQDHGPPTDAGPGQRAAAAGAWRAWWVRQKR